MDSSTRSRIIFPKAARRWRPIGVTPDVEVKLTRKALLAGHDAVVDAAVDWIKKQRAIK